jgi:hypothetical protein
MGILCFGSNTERNASDQEIQTEERTQAYYILSDNATVVLQTKSGSPRFKVLKATDGDTVQGLRFDVDNNVLIIKYRNPRNAKVYVAYDASTFVQIADPSHAQQYWFRNAAELLQELDDEDTLNFLTVSEMTELFDHMENCGVPTDYVVDCLVILDQKLSKQGEVATLLRHPGCFEEAYKNWWNLSSTSDLVRDASSPLNTFVDCYVEVLQNEAKEVWDVVEAEFEDEASKYENLFGSYRERYEKKWSEGLQLVDAVDIRRLFRGFERASRIAEAWQSQWTEFEQSGRSNKWNSWDEVKNFKIEGDTDYSDEILLGLKSAFADVTIRTTADADHTVLEISVESAVYGLDMPSDGRYRFYSGELPPQENESEGQSSWQTSTLMEDGMPGSDIDASFYADARAWNHMGEYFAGTRDEPTAGFLQV